ncbi:MAG: Histidyl-tRNA synthetase [Microgenomates group bacterium GW2011_GWC1_37_8]|uniref:Histidine--tRNA ligase n=1 Tax=Candidatus Woesebacteria bacterium GW2011_GWB1_38_8 TaxID=1618570 RepID=A0A0G0LDE1_9BACT|nr:MAG: Histidyl-tRNA synthetase [Microgenomates group bacterium GW2011_GWC1_37_8]KKQ85940.1 MAG: Histidyl-tRNA synthetase [Candidatus Woesebacteria bacterium GW2011_GWB1_38_8]
MDKAKLQTLKGFRDFLPKEARKRQYLVDKLKQVFELFGFEPLETPALEYKEILFGKSGEETDKLAYSFTDQGGREVALRYDQTVPTARVLGMYQNNLPMPFRRYQIQNAWRAENSQSGRYREFLQCDADIYGSPTPIADAEIISLTAYIYKFLGFKNFKIYINDRKILFELMNFASIPENLQFATVSAIDKLDRKSEDEVSDNLKGIGLSTESIRHLFHHLSESEPNNYLKEILKYANGLGVDDDNISFQARLARGLDYYTGLIFEVKIDEYKVGSVLGGGRYDKLIEKLSGTNIPAVGFGLGFDRTLEAMDMLKLFPDEGKRKGVLVTIFSPEFSGASFSTTKSLRDTNIEAEIFPDENAKLEKQLKYADKKGIKWLIVIGPEEVEKNTVILKNLKTGHQEDVKLNDLINKLKSD